MILLSNQLEQTLAPGQAVVFDLQIMKKGRCECHRTASSVVSLCTANVFDVSFSGNVTTVGTGSVGSGQLAIAVDGEALSYGTMIATPDVAGEILNVSKTIPVQGCCGCGAPKISIVNNGTTSVILEPNSSLYIRPRC